MKKKTLIQFIKFGIVGVSNTVISYLVYLVMVKLNCHYLVASMGGFIGGVLNSYYWNNKYVFQDKTIKRNPWKTLWKTFWSYAGSGLILGNLLLIMWIELFHIREEWAPILNLPITTIVNYILNKFWAYKTPTDEKQPIVKETE